MTRPDTSFDSDDEDLSPEICEVTGTYCTGLYCEDYNMCAKKAGFYDEQ